jgi:hypothetical protein
MLIQTRTRTVTYIRRQPPVRPATTLTPEDRAHALACLGREILEAFTRDALAFAELRVLVVQARAVVGPSDVGESALEREWFGE